MYHNVTSNLSTPSVGGADHNPLKEAVVSRGPVGQKSKAEFNRSDSISSAGEILCCSSLSSSDIRYYNKNILKKFEQEVVSKVCKGALELGVDLVSCGSKEGLESGAVGALKEVCLKEIQDNERRDEEARFRREHRKISLL
jgi:hypothetical protein